MNPLSEQRKPFILPVTGFFIISLERRICASLMLKNNGKKLPGQLQGDSLL